MGTLDRRKSRFVVVHCRVCHSEFKVPKFETAEFTCCGQTYLVVVLYGRIYVESISDPELEFIQTVNQAKRAMDSASLNKLTELTELTESTDDNI